MATVYKARDTLLDRLVALKLVPRDISTGVDHAALAAHGDRGPNAGVREAQDGGDGHPEQGEKGESENQGGAPFVGADPHPDQPDHWVTFRTPATV